MSPATIAHYRLGAKIGEGGMGEVYAATDTKLGRDVAIKIIPEEFAKDPDRMARFSREARLLASLNHPNIAAIYGVEERALVMELVDGATLADRISAGPISLDEALPIIEQIIDALEYAHDKAIIHRDLKPANIKITPEGRVKVLDFGLAKAFTGEPGTSNPEVSPTLTIGASAGLILGTAAYMSPEQARGRAVDRRADIWSFGVILYEMVTGERLFAGETVSDTLAAVLKHEVDFDVVPARLRALTSACLERDLRRRMRDIGDARLLLKQSEAPEPGRRRPRFAWLGWAFAVVLAAATALLVWRMPRKVEQPPLWATVDLGPDAVRGRDTSAVISPDGRKLAYFTRTAEGKQQLALRDLREPSGRSVLGFFDEGALKKVSARGGAPVSLCVARNGRGGSWGEDNYIIFASLSGGLSRVHQNGGTPELLTDPKASGHINDRWPQVLKGGGSVLFPRAVLEPTIWRSSHSRTGNGKRFGMAPILAGTCQAVT